MCKFFYLIKNHQKTKTKKPKIKLRGNLKIVSFVTIFLVLTVGIFYIVQINSLATNGYRIKAMGEKISDLQAISKELEGKILILQSSEAVNERVAKMAMVKATEVEYLVPKKEEVAVGFGNF